MPRDQIHRQRRVLFVGAASGGCHELLPQLAADASFTFETIETGAGAVALALRTTPQFDAMLVDVDLSDGDGAWVCARIRENGVHVPILLIAELGDEPSIIHGLDSGANDYIQAPFRVAEVMARLRAQIRAYEVSEEAVLAIGPFQFRPARRVLQHSLTNERVRLTEKEAAVLKFLYRAEGPVPRNTLLHEVWGYNAKATTHTVETHIYRLRRKIEPDPTKIALLVNESGGYRLCVDQPLPIPKWSPMADSMTAAE